MTPYPAILILAHDPRQRPALLGDLIARAGLASLCLAIDGPARLPSAHMVDGCHALVLLDAPPASEVHCRDAELALVAALHAAGRPLLGLGTGAHTLTRALGGTVRPAPAAVRGWFRLGLHPQAARGAWLALLGTTLPHALQDFTDEFAPPPGALALLAGTPATCQGWAYGHSLALNPLLHADPGLCAEWLEDWRDTPLRPAAGCQSSDELAAGVTKHLPAQRVFATTLFGAWLEQARKPVGGV
ncbi:MAG: hypothetical protein RLW61_03655 [Gammaproteobacteria bacterium]